MKSVYLLFGGTLMTEIVWEQIGQSKYSDQLNGEPVALLQEGDVLLVLLRGEKDLPERVPALVREIRGRVIQESFTYVVLVQHEANLCSGKDWDAAYFASYGGVTLLGAVNRLINSTHLSEEFPKLVEHLKKRAGNRRHGIQQ